MRIAIIGPFFYPQMYGVEKVMYNHAKHLAGRGHDVHVITSALRFPDGVLPNLPRVESHNGFTIHRLPVLLRAPWRRYFPYPSNGGLLIPGLRGMLDELAPDVVHTHNIGAPAWSHAAARYANARGKRLFYSPHFHAGEQNLKLYRLRTIFVNGLNALPLRSATRIFHLTSIDFDPFIREFPYVDRSRFTVLSNGVDPPACAKELRAETAPVRLLFVGRVDDGRKGFKYLIEAMRTVWARQASSSPPELTVVGRVSDATRLPLEQEFGPRIRFTGEVSEIELDRQYAAADVFVMPSLYEGFGMPYIEAMRFGTPVIGTTAGGIPAVVPDGTGILVPPADAPALADAIVKLIDDDALRTRMGDAGKEWASNFGWPRIVDRLEAFYRGEAA